MLRTLAAPVLSLTLAACAAPGRPAPGPAAADVGADAAVQPPPAAESILERGGDLGSLDTREPTLRFDGDVLVVTGIVEVPPDSRLQAAYAMADAVTRSELAKAIAVHIVSLETDRATGRGETEVSLYHAEATRALLQLLPQATHGWQKVGRDDGVTLRLFARLRVPRASVTDGVAATLAARGRDPVGAGAIVRSLAPER